MIKVLSFTARRPEFSPAEFARYWHDIHAPMWAAIPGIRGYVTSSIIAENVRGDVPSIAMAPFDGVVEIWYDDMARMAASAGSPEGQAWRADSALFIGGMRTFLTSELPVVPFPGGKRPPIKALSIVKRPASASAPDFQHYWANVHAPMAREVPQLKGFVLSRLLEERTRIDLPPFPMDGPVDGFTSSFVDSVADRERLVTSAEAKRWFADGATFLGAVKSFLLEERVHLAPPVA
ncbi:MAG: EthD family reductase [Hyphomicrobiaceae bacterium]